MTQTPKSDYEPEWIRPLKVRQYLVTRVSRAAYDAMHDELNKLRDGELISIAAGNFPKSTWFVTDYLTHLGGNLYIAIAFSILQERGLECGISREMKWHDVGHYHLGYKHTPLDRKP